MDSIKSQLVAMGFAETKISKAINSCPDAQTLEQVMEWLIAHEDELNAGESTSSATTIPASGAQSGKTPAEPKQATIKDDDFRPEETAAETAVRKKITVEEAQRLIIERQAIRAEDERKKAIEDEKKRRLDGQKMIQTRADLEDLERIRLAQQIRREKLELEAHKKRLLEQIALDRENMKAKQSPMKTSTSSSNNTTKSQPKASSNECRIALRFPDGTSKVQKFSPQEQLAAVRLFVQMEKTSAQSANIEFIAPPNKKMADAQMHETLESLGLCPASRLEVKYNKSELVEMD